MKHILAILAFAAVFCAFAEKQPFERYQTIIDRMPFGQPPPGFDPTRDPSEVSKNEYSQTETELTQEQEAIQKAVRFSVINVENDGTVRVGFTDLTDTKAPRHFYLAVGETRGGWSVKDADANEKKMTVEKDGVEVELTLGENSGGIDGKAVANARNATKGAHRSALLGRNAGSDGRAPMSMRGRREKREAEEAARRAEDEKLAAERERERLEREKREEEERAQREAERAEQREQLNALKAELMRQREEAKAARERDGDSDEEEEESSDE